MRPRRGGGAGPEQDRGPRGPPKGAWREGGAEAEPRGLEEGLRLRAAGQGNRGACGCKFTAEGKKADTQPAFVRCRLRLGWSDRGLGPIERQSQWETQMKPVTVMSLRLKWGRPTLQLLRESFPRESRHRGPRGPGGQSLFDRAV